MSLWKDTGIGFRGYRKSFYFIFNKGLWIYFFYPLVITLLLFFVGYALIQTVSDELEQWFLGLTGLRHNTEGFFFFLNGFFSFLITVAANIVFWFVFSTFNKYITLILLSPVLALLSEKTEAILTGEKYPFSVNRFVYDIWRGILIALRNMLIEFSIITLALLAIFVPIVNFFVPIILFIVSAYFYGFSMMDYMSERRKMKISQSIAFVRKYKGTAIANGSIFAVLLWIPFIGVIFAPVFAVIAATISVHELTGKKFDV